MTVSCQRTRPYTEASETAKSKLAFAAARKGQVDAASRVVDGGVEDRSVALTYGEVS